MESHVMTVPTFRMDIDSIDYDLSELEKEQVVENQPFKSFIDKQIENHPSRSLLIFNDRGQKDVLINTF